jgi:hypothetical protein
MIPKSLHTVSALVNVALHLMRYMPAAAATASIAVDMAANMLGYHDGIADVHELKDAARAKLAKVSR